MNETLTLSDWPPWVLDVVGTSLIAAFTFMALALLLEYRGGAHLLKEEGDKKKERLNQPHDIRVILVL